MQTVKMTDLFKQCAGDSEDCGEEAETSNTVGVSREQVLCHAYMLCASN